MTEPRLHRVTISADDVGDLFRDRPFDPFQDEVGTLSSLAQLAELPQLARKLRATEVLVLVPPSQFSPDTEQRVRQALQRYCQHAIVETRRKSAAQRWVGWRSLLAGVFFFGLSLAAAAAIGRWTGVPENLRTLASESLIVAGWVVIWMPLDALVQGLWPYWRVERTYAALSAVRLTVKSQ
jgi:hypothetical protein